MLIGVKVTKKNKVIERLSESLRNMTFLGFPAVKVIEKRLYVQNEKDEKFVKVTKRDNK